MNDDSVETERSLKRTHAQPAFWQTGWETVPAHLLAFVRFALGIAVAVWASKYLQDRVWYHIYVEPTFLFKYPGFEWVTLWPNNGIYWHFVATVVLGTCLAFGFLTRLSATLLCVSIWYILLVEAQIYVNHYYLLACLCGMVAVLPAGSFLSIDSLVWRQPHDQPKSTPVYRWHIWLLRFQIALPYFFGAIAKLNLDWLRGQPMGLLLINREDVPLVGPCLQEPWIVMGFTYGGLLFDLLVIPMLLWKPTRWLAVAWACAFHLTNALLLNIGVFPWFMLATLIVFFPIDTLPKLLDRLGVRSVRHRAVDTGGPLRPAERFAAVLALGYVVLNLYLPMRPWTVGGDPSWHECSHRYAWRMMLRNKRCLLHYLVVDSDTKAFLYLPANNIMTAYQQKRAQQAPDLIRQGAAQLAIEASRRGATNTQVYALALVSLNGRKPVPLVDPNVDLTSVGPATSSADWITPDPGPFCEPIWAGDENDWWNALELPDRFSNLQGKTPQELLEFLEHVSESQEK